VEAWRVIHTGGRAVRRGGDVDRAIEWIAARNNRVVTWCALEAAGVGHRAVEHRVAIGRLYRRHNGVYLLEPPGEASRLTLLTAAVAACGPDALLSHRSAAELWGILPSHHGDIDVTVTGRNPGERPGIRRHRTRALERRDIRHRQRIRVTSPARTVIDNARDPDLEELLAAAIGGRLVRPRQVEQAIARSPTRPGVARLRAILRQDGGPRLTRSWGERRLLALIRKAGLPVPDTNVPLHGFKVDALWRDPRLVVEVDGYEFHGGRAAFEADRARDATHVAAGYRVIRFTAVQLRDEPLVVIARLAAALAVALQAT
jgi:very-short-patch-repair endonuclease